MLLAISRNLSSRVGGEVELTASWKYRQSKRDQCCHKLKGCSKSGSTVQNGSSPSVHIPYRTAGFVGSGIRPGSDMSERAAAPNPKAGTCASLQGIVICTVGTASQQLLGDENSISPIIFFGQKHVLAARERNGNPRFFLHHAVLPDEVHLCRYISAALASLQNHVFHSVQEPYDACAVSWYHGVLFRPAVQWFGPFVGTLFGNNNA